MSAYRLVTYEKGMHNARNTYHTISFGSLYCQSFISKRNAKGSRKDRKGIGAAVRQLIFQNGRPTLADNEPRTRPAR